MQAFQNMPLLRPASEATATTFERFLLLAGGSSSNNNSQETAASSSSKALEVLYVLDALKDILPLMSVKFINKILNYFKSLLALHQTAATRRITDPLYLLCIQPTLQVSPEALMDLLCSLAISVSSNEMSGDSMTFTARLLDANMKKVFSLNRQTCVVKLPVVFSAFKDILASEHEEPLAVAMEAFKSLIHTCIDDILIKQGVDQIMTSGSARKTGPTIIEKLCATVESLLDYSYAAAWDISYFFKGAVKSLEDIQKLPDEDFPYRKQLHDCMGAALVALGPETFLKFLPLNVEAQDLSDANVWLFPILKQNIVGASLSFFNESLLDTVRVLKLKSAKHEQECRIHSARSIDGLEQPNLRGVICSSLQILIRQNKEVIEGENEPSGKELSICEQRAVSRYTSEVAARNLDVLRSSAREILPTLSGIFIKSSKDDGGSLQRDFP
ncbi:Armadillo-like helical [Artemisia annua]|uniref:Armadillo-like helical n=1 Tax=Artemisia annua TaxID=35608 RepID=A0A2U1Q546_ARTAN|nr:Armadillo-like helical [Artemisia annua]